MSEKSLIKNHNTFDNISNNSFEKSEQSQTFSEIVDPSLESQLSGWLAYLSVQKKYSPNTVISYKRDVHNFVLFMTSHKGQPISLEILNSLKIGDFRAWLAARSNSGLIARSNVRALSSVRSLFNYLAEKRLANTDTINLLQRPKIPKLLPKPIEENTILDFLNAPYFFEKDPLWITNRDRALYHLLYCTGLRINEALSIKTREISSSIKICGKGKNERMVLILPLVLEKIEAYTKTCPYDIADGFLFVGLRGRKLLAPYVDARLEKLRMIHNLPDHASAHAFRHSFATHLIQNGADLRSVQDLLGHESLSSTQIYTDVNDYNILKIYEQTHPMAKNSVS